MAPNPISWFEYQSGYPRKAPGLTLPPAVQVRLWASGRIRLSSKALKEGFAELFRNWKEPTRPSSPKGATELHRDFRRHFTLSKGFKMVAPKRFSLEPRSSGGPSGYIYWSMSIRYPRRPAQFRLPALLLLIALPALSGWAQDDCNVPVCSHFQGETYVSIAAADSLTAVAIGFKPFISGNIMRRSTDGGRTWKPVALPFVEGLYTIRFASSTLGFIAGASWTPLTLARVPLASIDFVDTSNGFGVGGRAAYRTHDGGLTWDSLKIWHSLPYSLYPPTLYSVAFRNALRGAVVGAGPLIIPTQNGGASWGPGYIKNGTENDGARTALWAGPEYLVVADNEGYVHLAKGMPVDWIKIRAATIALNDLAMLRPGAYLVVGMNTIARVDEPGPTRLLEAYPDSRPAESAHPILSGSWVFPSQGLWRNLQGRGIPGHVGNSLPGR